MKRGLISILVWFQFMISWFSGCRGLLLWHWHADHDDDAGSDRSKQAFRKARRRGRRRRCFLDTILILLRGFGSTPSFTAVLCHLRCWRWCTLATHDTSENSQGLSFCLSLCLNAVLQSIARSSVLFACWYLLHCLLARLTCLALQAAGLFLFVCLLCVLNKWNLGIPQARDLNLVYLQMITELDQANQSINDIQHFLTGYFLHICEVGGLVIMHKRT
jgi:hypothetical protein